MAELLITDDGDETVFINVIGIEDHIVVRVDHDRYGWAGMEAIIEFVEDTAKMLNVTVRNNQNIV